MFCCELKNVILEKMAEESENENCSKEVRIQQLLGENFKMQVGHLVLFLASSGSIIRPLLSMLKC